MGNDMQMEKERLAALHAFELLDTVASENFDRICRLAAQCFNVPTAMISLVDQDRQWFKSRIGFDRAETPLNESFCAHTIQQRGVMQVPNAHLDARFRDNRLVKDAPNICFYAGAPLITVSGYAIGSLCILDHQPRKLTELEMAQLQDFAHLVMQQVETRQLMRRREPVSGLPNSQQFLADLRDLPTHCPGENRLLVLIEALDIGRAHEMAQALGTEPCDSMILLFAGRLRECLKGWAHVYQVAAARFAFIVPGDPGHRERLDALIATLRQPVIARSIPIEPPVYAGVVAFEIDQANVSDALRKAFSALETARSTRRPWAMYDALRDDSFRRAYNLAADMPEALRRNELYPAFQPRVNIAEQKVSGAELLLRWQHPLLGIVPPGEFIPVIEKTALIHPMTSWVIDAAFAQIALWQTAFTGRLSINLSPRNFEEGTLVDELHAACERHNVDPTRLEVEITEGEWLRCNADVLDQLAAIRHMGIDVAIDDFGNGYSNFAYLQEIPANVLKLDMSLMQDLEHNPRNQLIVRSIIELARQLGYRTVAEGIETAAAFRLVKAFGCDEAQGYFIAKPMGLAEFDAWSF